MVPENVHTLPPQKGLEIPGAGGGGGGDQRPKTLRKCFKVDWNFQRGGRGGGGGRRKKSLP